MCGDYTFQCSYISASGNCIKRLMQYALAAWFGIQLKRVWDRWRVNHSRNTARTAITTDVDPQTRDTSLYTMPAPFMTGSSLNIRDSIRPFHGCHSTQMYLNSFIIKLSTFWMTTWGRSVPQHKRL